MKMSDEEAAQIKTVGQAVDFVLAPRDRPRRGPDRCSSARTTCSSELPEDLARQAFTHASWVERRVDSYERLAFLGDCVLGLAVTTHLYPRLEAGALRRRPADQDPRAGGVGPLLPGGRRAARAAGAPARRGAAGVARAGDRGAGARPSACWRR